MDRFPWRARALTLALTATALAAAAPAHADSKQSQPPTQPTGGCYVQTSGAGLHIRLHFNVGQVLEGYDANGKVRRFKCTDHGWDTTALIVRAGDVAAQIGGTLELLPSGEIEVTPAAAIG